MQRNLKSEARRFVQTGVLPLYMHSLKMQEAQAFWSYVRSLEG
jgi:hypothetical protein